ncbi:hypothetical protein I4U23_023710 [Adineta vaga]|nr:hypothetical protein I4U23_023710 [Adineta vaga]
MVHSVDETLNSRTEELKQSLFLWRHILLPINNLFQWKHKQDPFIISGFITLIFLIVFQTNPSVLTLCCSIVLIFVLIDLLVPVSMPLIFKNEKWTSKDDLEYTKFCEQIAHFEQFVKLKCQTALKMREEQPTMYLMIGGISLGFLAFCGQRIDNLLLCYFITLVICLIPGIRHRQLITSIS